jgi:hypothetical protein
MLGINPESGDGTPPPPEPVPAPPPWALGYGGQAAPPPAPYAGVPADVSPPPADPRMIGGPWEQPAGFPEAGSQPGRHASYPDPSYPDPSYPDPSYAEPSYADPDMDPGHGRHQGAVDETAAGRRPEPPREDNVIMLDVQDGPVGARVVER